MTVGGYDYAVLGSTPFASLLAGLLAATHGRRVCLVAEPFSPHRPGRSLELSLAPITRAETLLLLRQVVPETLKLLADLGKGLSRKVDPLFAAELPSTIAAHSHFRHQALALGHQVDRLVDRTLSPGAIFRVRDVHHLLAGRIEPALLLWLDRLGVTRFDARHVSLSIRRDGEARISSGENEIVAGHAILADDAAILTHLTEDQRGRRLRVGSGTSIVTSPARSLHAPVIVYTDRAVSLQQRESSGILALIGGETQTAHARLGASLQEQRHLARAGEARYRVLSTSDGAPLLTTARGAKATLIAGFGVTGAFLAPAVARMIAGAASPDERQWFALRDSTRGTLRERAAEFEAVPP